ncbi:hypothetical protein ACP275_04G129700 [Erythranthe tilingii]
MTARSTTIKREKGTFLFQRVQPLLEKFDSIRNELVKIKYTKSSEDHPQHKFSAAEATVSFSSSSSSSKLLPSGKSTMVGFDEQVNEVMCMLSRDQSNRLIVPIVGMGGIGKTTLATNVYNHDFIVERFHVRAWVKISQEYTKKEILLDIWRQVSVRYDKESSDGNIGELLFKELVGRKYLILMDDMWDIKAWDEVKSCLPDNNNGSRILVTTRLSKLAEDFGSSSPHTMQPLDEEQSWDLFCNKVFPKEVCPVELEKIGKYIAARCRGLPLALVVIGRLLAKSKMTREHWEYVAERVTSAVNYEDNEYFMKILSLSYTHLPICLKSCFLYLAVFPEDFEIRVSMLIRLWVAEGFIKPTRAKSLEEVAEEYLEDLVDRNLVLVRERGLSGKVKACGIHDLLRDLCTREAHKDKFMYVAKLNDPNCSPYIQSERRLSIRSGPWKHKVFETSKSAFSRSAAFIRSFLVYSVSNSTSDIACKLRLVRVLRMGDRNAEAETSPLFNLRYVDCYMGSKLLSSFIFQLWNLQTLVVDINIALPAEIWQMPQLRHIKMREISLCDPPDSQNTLVLENLQTLSTVQDFKCNQQVITRIPNLKKLGVHYRTDEIEPFCLTNLAGLRKLESLVLEFSAGISDNIAFPDSLKKLALSECKIPWEDMSIVGSLPNLEVLKLKSGAAKGEKWIPIEGQFGRLKFLLIDQCELEIWEADNTHFPCLEHLVLGDVSLKEIPIDFAEILNLRVIVLPRVKSSLWTSAEEISEERMNLGYEGLKIQPFRLPVTMYLYEESKELDVISIIGMSGLGKTTLAWKIYNDSRVQFEFPTMIWVYVPQEFKRRDFFLTILKKFTEEDMSSKTDNELMSLVRYYLQKSKFILFMDDVWTAEAWRDIEAALPKSNKFGKVVITSRYEAVALLANQKRRPHRLRFLDSMESWKLLQLEVFRNLDDYPPELETLGKYMANQCRGLPLAIVLIGGILVEKLSQGEGAVMKTEWEKISERMSQYLNEEKRGTENIIAFSYNQLPHDLRDCFLYLGMFPEGTEIHAWKLIRLWIAEGFIQQKPKKSLEEVAEDNLKNLINRNLVVVQKTKAEGGIKTCRIHGMIREFCKYEAAIARHNLFQEINKSMGVFDPRVSEIHKYPRLCIHSYVVDFLRMQPRGPKVRSFLCFSKEAIILPIENIPSIPAAFESLRVLDVNPIKFSIFPVKLTQLIHLKYIALSGDEFKSLPDAVSKLWNLQTIRIDTMSRTFEIKANIWKMRQLRHFKTEAAIILSSESKGEVAENLQTLSTLSTQCCTEDLFNKTPNLINLGIRGDLDTLSDSKCLRKLNRLQKLKLVYDVFPDVISENPLSRLPQPDQFPPNLKILELSATCLHWTHMSTLGNLGALKVLKLKDFAFVGKVWGAGGEGKFASLEFLLIARTNLEFWHASNDCFPGLKCLVLKNCEKLEEIPLLLYKSLQVLDIERVSITTVASARKIEAVKENMQGQQHRAKRGGFKLYSFSAIPQ